MIDVMRKIKVVDLGLNYEATTIIDSLVKTVGLQTITKEYYDGRPPSVFEMPILENSYQVEEVREELKIDVNETRIIVPDFSTKSFKLDSGPTIKTIVQTIVMTDNFCFLFKALSVGDIIPKSIWSDIAIKNTVTEFMKENDI